MTTRAQEHELKINTAERGEPTDRAIASAYFDAYVRSFPGDHTMEFTFHDESVLYIDRIKCAEAL